MSPSLPQAQLLSQVWVSRTIVFFHPGGRLWAEAGGVGKGHLLEAVLAETGVVGAAGMAGRGLSLLQQL